jgi:hypothetical protein
MMDLCMADQIGGAKTQITSLATVSGLLAGFTATVLTGVSPDDFLISAFLLGSAVCNLSAMVVSSLLLVVLFMDFTNLPQCRQRGRLTTHMGPLYVYAFVMFGLGVASFIGFLLAFAFHQLDPVIAYCTVGALAGSVLLCICASICGMSIHKEEYDSLRDPTPLIVVTGGSNDGVLATPNATNTREQFYYAESLLAYQQQHQQHLPPPPYQLPPSTSSTTAPPSTSSVALLSTSLLAPTGSFAPSEVLRPPTPTRRASSPTLPTASASLPTLPSETSTTRASATSPRPHNESNDNVYQPGQKLQLSHQQQQYQQPNSRSPLLPQTIKYQVL